MFLIFGTVMAVLAILGVSGKVIAVAAVIGGGLTAAIAVGTKGRAS